MAHDISVRKLTQGIAMTTLVFTMSTHAADFAPIKSVPVGANTAGLASADLNGDGVPDLVSTNLDDNTVSVRLGTTDNLGDFSGTTDISVGAGGPFAVAIGNVVGDANADIVVGKLSGNEITILPGNGDGTFGGAIPFTPASTAFTAPADVVLGDVDGDTDLDLIVADFTAPSVRVFQNDDNSDTFTEAASALPASGSSPYGLVFADATGDAINDIVFANADAAVNTVTVLEGANNATFTLFGSFPTGTRPYTVAVADFDGSLGPDLAVADTNDGTVSILLNDGAGGFNAAVPYTVGTDPLEIAIANVNGDSNVDLVVTNNGSDNISVLEGDGAGGFSPVTPFAAGTAPKPLAVDDFDGDGLDDVAVGGEGATSTDVSVLINDNPPVAVDDSFSVISGSTDVALDVLANDSDPDAGDTLTITEVGTPSNMDGAVTINGTADGLVYGNTGSDPTDSFTYTVQDQFGYAATATVTIAPDQAPSFTSMPVTVATQDVAYTYDVTATDPDAGDTLTITAPTLPAWLTLTDNGDGTATLTGTPTNADVGDNSVSLLVSDSGNGTATQAFTITVANVNDAPSFTSTPVTTATENAAYTYDVTATDPDTGDTPAITASGLPAWLTLTDNGNGTATLSGTPDSSDVGDSNITLTASDGTASTDQTFTLTVDSAPSTSSSGGGGGGGGCTLAGEDAGRDPLMPLMMLGALATLYTRRRKKMAGRTAA
jgi:hypothetical protein